MASLRQRRARSATRTKLLREVVGNESFSGKRTKAPPARRFSWSEPRRAAAFGCQQFELRRVPLARAEENRARPFEALLDPRLVPPPLLYRRQPAVSPSTGCRSLLEQ